MTDYDTEKVNYPQNSIFYVNQRNLIIKQKRKKCTMVTTFWLDRIFCAKYNTSTGEFLGL